MQKYYLTSRYKYLYTGIRIAGTSLLVIFFLYVFRDSFWLTFYFICFGLIGVLSIFYENQNEYIALTEKGIEYHRLWLVFETKWENLETISSYKHNYIKNEVLLVETGNIQITKWSIGRGPDGFSQKTIIPLSCFAEDWRNSELGREIKQHAPHLFEKENKQSA